MSMTTVAGWEPFSKQKATKWLLCIAAALGAIALLGSTGIVFALLLALMLTGMPISIALGLTVLSFLFFFTEIPTEAVAMKLFTGIEKFEIMAIPFFILAGNFLTHGGVAKRMINFATSMVGHLVWRPGSVRCHSLRSVRRCFRIKSGYCRGYRLNPAAGHG